MRNEVMLSPAEAERAIYIDFEGTKTDPPSLLGSLFSPGRSKVDPDRLVYQLDILEPALAATQNAVVNNGNAELRSRVRSMASTIGELVGRAEKQNRWLVSWSQRELTAVRNARLPDDLVHRFEASWANAIPMAEAWKEEAFPAVSFPWSANGGANKLSRYLDLVGYEVAELGSEIKPADAVLKLRKGLAFRGSFGALLPSQQKQWLGLVMHNFDDCAGMRRVVEAAVEHLAA